MASNATNGTNAANAANATNALGFAARVLRHACPGNTPDHIRAATDAHLNPIQLVLTACLVVAVLSIVPQLLRRIELGIFDLNRDGKVDAKDVDVCVARACAWRKKWWCSCCCGGKKRKKCSATVRPAPAPRDVEEGRAEAPARAPPVSTAGGGGGGGSNDRADPSDGATSATLTGNAKQE